MMTHFEKNSQINQSALEFQRKLPEPFRGKRMITGSVTLIVATILVVTAVIGQIFEWVDKLGKYPSIKKLVEGKTLRVVLLLIAVLLLAAVFSALNEVRQALNSPPPRQRPPLPLNLKDIFSTPTPALKVSGPIHPKKARAINVQGSISQQGQINQVGANSQATINPDVNPYKPIITYERNGFQRITSPGKVMAGNGEMEAFQKMNDLYGAKDWRNLIDLCESEMKKAPEWYTPYIYAGVAYGNLGQVEKAIEDLEHADKHVGDVSGYEDVRQDLTILKEIKEKQSH
jgi:hypothetical protein